MRILKDKRGAAIEMAILFLIVIYSFCLLISMTSLLGVQRSKIERLENGAAIEREQLAEDFVAYVADGGAESFLAFSADKYKGYEMEESTDAGGMVLLTLKKNGKEVLWLAAVKTQAGARLHYCKTTGQ